MRRTFAFTLVFAGTLAVTAQRTETPAQSCVGVLRLALANASVISAEVVAAGTFKPPDAAVSTSSDLPGFCRVAATLRPSSDSDIKTEVWLPIAGWNGKLLAVGNGASRRSVDSFPR